MQFAAHSLVKGLLSAVIGLLVVSVGQVRVALTGSQDDLTVFFTSPFSVLFLLTVGPLRRMVAVGGAEDRGPAGRAADANPQHPRYCRGCV